MKWKYRSGKNAKIYWRKENSGSKSFGGNHSRQIGLTESREKTMEWHTEVFRDEGKREIDGWMEGNTHTAGLLEGVRNHASVG